MNRPVSVDLFLLGLRLSPTGRVTLPALGGLETRIGGDALTDITTNESAFAIISPHAKQRMHYRTRQTGLGTAPVKP